MNQYNYFLYILPIVYLYSYVPKKMNFWVDKFVAVRKKHTLPYDWLYCILCDTPQRVNKLSNGRMKHRQRCVKCNQSIS